jgi:dCTP deaminase
MDPNGGLFPKSEGFQMILSDREIRAALNRESIRISPDPRFDKKVWSSTALDLRLHEKPARWDLSAGVGTPFRPADPDYDFNAILQRFEKTLIIPTDGLEIKPGEFYLGWTIERLQLPHRSRIAARVEGKSSLARLGLGVHVTAPTIHAGFGHKPTQTDYPGSSIQLEIWNFGPGSIVLQTGMKICQLIFESVDGTPEMGYEGRFSVQGPQLSEPSKPPHATPAKRKRRGQ